MPTDPVPLYKSNQRPGLRDAGQPPAAYMGKKMKKKFDETLNFPTLIYSKIEGQQIVSSNTIAHKGVEGKYNNAQ